MVKRMRLVVFCCCLLGVGVHASDRQQCAGCHSSISESYARTAMASSSGVAGTSGSAIEHFDRAAFQHDATGYRYRVSKDGDALTFELAKDTLSAKRPLRYFVGSGATARSYLLSADGYLYEAPVAYYSSAARWDLAPGYDRYAFPYLTRPVMPGCLHCHATGLNTVAGTQNRYAAKPFQKSGIGCERCHGPGDEHIARAKSGRLAKQGSGIVNPAKLDADRRDSVCAQCHLLGEVRVFRPGRDWHSYQPGARLSDTMTVFVRANAAPGLTVTSHGEKLEQSACKRVAADRLWCGSCHDPHSEPPPEQRASWFRTKCLSCHATAHPCKESLPVRRAKQDDCTSCHMPKSGASDAQHVVYTDHSIPRRPTAAKAAASMELAALGSKASSRDMALAVAIMAGRTGNNDQQKRAVNLLAEAEKSNPDDVEVLLYLAELYRNTDQPDAAIGLYKRAIRLDPTQVTGSVGLGGIRMERGDYSEAIRLWSEALVKNPGLLWVRTNMALAYFKLGNREMAESLLRQTLDLNPGFPPAAEALKQLRK